MTLEEAAYSVRRPGFQCLRIAQPISSSVMSRLFLDQRQRKVRVLESNGDVLPPRCLAAYASSHPISDETHLDC